jgi:hypothetical protein
MRAGCIAQEVIVLRPVQTRWGGTSTERLKTGAEQFLRLATSSARRVLRPTGPGSFSLTRPFAGAPIGPSAGAPLSPRRSLLGFGLRCDRSIAGYRRCRNFRFHGSSDGGPALFTS